MSWTSPASTCSRRPPPPQDWNRSGTSPAWRLVCSAALNASFSITVMLIVTLGFASMNSLAMSCQTVIMGSVFWICHHSMVTGSAGAPVVVVASAPVVVVASGAPLVVVPSSPDPSPHAATSRTRMASKANGLLSIRFTCLLLPTLVVRTLVFAMVENVFISSWSFPTHSSSGFRQVEMARQDCRTTNSVGNVR